MELEKLEQEIKKYATQKGIKLIEGLEHGESQIFFEPIGIDHKGFIDLAKELNCSFILLNKSKYIEEGYIEVKKNLDREEKADINEKIISLKQKYAEHLNKLCMIKLVFTKEGCIFNLVFFSDWFESLNNEIQLLQEKYDTLAEEIQEENDGKLEEVIEELSINQEFLKLKNRNQRYIYIKNKYPEIKRGYYTIEAKARALANIKDKS